ncbi:LOW QUALITY PROTEIN: myocardin [Boleophthalmus pectinirostris]|uniref:LOW QUALITY PROTEIN: myocardin n=1 Tax=Boleophthalmus pectinirostris TaxID=150288 RepID=UPI00242D9625|nr:LOW QUALITY PROTEIN: myocardin [Boleophthalmus pectinirostris]
MSKATFTGQHPRELCLTNQHPERGQQVLQFRLQQRRSREAQAEEGSMPLNHGKFPKQEDSYAFEEDSSSGSLSPEQQVSEPESHSSACTAEGSSLASALASPCQTGSRDISGQIQEEGCSSQTTAPVPVPAIVKSKSSDKNRHKKPKDVKPKVKKLKYHQYIPPDQKGERSPPPMDSAYARLLQQQQLFLQLQILSQQKHAHTQSHHQHPHNTHQHLHGTQGPARQPAFSYQPHPPTHNHKGTSEQLSCSSSSANSNSSSPIKNAFPNQNSISAVKPGPLPANLDDLKVSELRQHLRMRGMPVSGTKTSLIERLRPFTEPCCGSSPPSDITTGTFPVTPSGSLTSSSLSQGFYPSYTSSSSPPMSPASSELSLNGSLPESFSDMSPHTHFTLQPSPTDMEEGLGAGHGVEGAGLDGLGTGQEGMEAEKDKMLVEKQKVIDELTWKLHQEQRQVEELKMQLHKRKRSYGSTQETGPPLPSMPQHSPSLMGQHFFGVTVKQEPVPLSSSCPLSSPKQLKSPGVGHMEEAGPGGTQLMDGAPHSAFLSPQASPQDSPPGKTSHSPQPLSPHAPYLLTPPLGRDECGHPHGLGGARLCSMQVQQKSGGQMMNCSYPSDHRVYPSDTGVSHGSSVKSENMSKRSLCPPAGQRCHCNSVRQPPCYEEALQQQLNRSQQMDELLDVLIENGGCPGLLVPRFHRHYEHPPPGQLPYDHPANHLPEGHLETLLSTPIGRSMEGEGEGYSAQPRQPHHVGDKLLLSAPELQGVAFSMAFSEAPWDNMEWLDLTPPTSANTYSVAPPTAPSVFTSEFLDVTDMSLSAAMDLPLDHW